MEGTTILEILRNANANGLGMAFISILFYLFIYNGIIYLKNKEVYYLYYSLYVLVNVLVFSKYQTNVFFENNELYAHLMLWLTYPLFFFSFVFFDYLSLPFLNSRKGNPNFIVSISIIT